MAQTGRDGESGARSPRVPVLVLWAGNEAETTAPHRDRQAAKIAKQFYITPAHAAVVAELAFETRGRRS